MKKITLHTLMFFATLAVAMVTGLTNAHADEQVGAITVNNLGNLRGNYLSVYYGVGSRASIATSASQVTLREVRAKVTVRIDGNSVTIPAIQLQRSGISVAYNIIAFAVHRGASYVLVNADGSAPKGETATQTSELLLMDSLTKSEVTALGGPGPISVSLK